MIFITAGYTRPRPLADAGEVVLRRWAELHEHLPADSDQTLAWYRSDSARRCHGGAMSRAITMRLDGSTASRAKRTVSRFICSTLLEGLSPAMLSLWAFVWPSRPQGQAFAALHTSSWRSAWCVPFWSESSTKQITGDPSQPNPS